MMGARLAMYASSYIPLYLLLVMKYVVDVLLGGALWCLFGNVVALVLMIGSASLAFALWQTVSRAQEEVGKEVSGTHGSARFCVVSVTNGTSPELLNYLAVYFMPCLNMSIARASDAIVMLFVMIVVGFIYLKECATYLNPMLLLYGYRSYGCVISEAPVSSDGEEGKPGDQHYAILMRKGADPILAGRTYDGKRFHDFVMLAL